MIYEQQNSFIIDNFYSNPDEVRKYALSLPYRQDVHGHHFWRSTPKINMAVIPPLEKYLGIKIDIDQHWIEFAEDDYVDLNMSFYKVINNPNENYARATHIHHDLTHWSGIVYLSPNLPASAGTQLWRHKQSGDEFAHGNIGFTGKAFTEHTEDTRGEDTTKWEKTDYFAYKYNRLILFRGTMFHSAAHTKDTPDGERLNQFFYFNQKLTEQQTKL